jgi:hypothetical protein
VAVASNASADVPNSIFFVSGYAMLENGTVIGPRRKCPTPTVYFGDPGFREGDHNFLVDETGDRGHPQQNRGDRRRPAGRKAEGEPVGVNPRMTPGGTPSTRKPRTSIWR